LEEADASSRSLGAANLTDDLLASIEKLRSACIVQPAENLLSPIEQADREDEIAGWLSLHKIKTTDAGQLASTPVTIDMLDALSHKLSGKTLSIAILWITNYCATQSLAIDIEQAAKRISELVAAIKRFTYMDNLAGSDLVDVEPGLRDTLKVLAAKSKSKAASITLDIEKNLPQVRATGSELNQVWMNIIDNALDAIADSGNINISAQLEMNRVMVRIVDDGHGIPEELLPHIFDPFFTTKSPGQGTGLGLDITQRLLRMYHGDINVKSHPGRTEFVVTLITEKSV
jgi:signal transduction histidine kinase